MKLSEAQKEIEEKYEKAGWSLSWQCYIHPKKQHCFWHGGEYAIAKKRYRGHDWTAVFGTFGDVIGELFDKDGEILASVWDKNNAADRNDNEDYSHTDVQLKKAMESGRLELEDNNWDEMLIEKDGEPADGGFGAVSDEDDVIKDIWAPGDIEQYIDVNFIEEEEEK